MWGGKTAVFHVGAHKTGTTVVQQYLQANREDLARRHIRLVSRSELSPAIGWGGLLRSEPGVMRQHLRSFQRNPWYWVFLASNENIVGRPFVRGGAAMYPEAPDNLEALAGLLSPFRAKIVLTVRPQAEMLESYYLQSINLGGREVFAKWLSRIDLDALSWQPLIAALRQHFGPDQVEIIDFGLIRQGQEFYIRHVLARMHRRLDREVNYTRSRNPGLSGPGLAMALAVHPYLQSPEERALMRSFLQRHFSHSTHARAVLLSDSQRDELSARYDAEYASLVAPVGALEPAR